MRLLLVEDDPMIGQGLEQALADAGYALDWVRQAGLAETALRTTQYDGVLLDLGLPDLDGIELLRRLRTRGESVPVLIVTARDAVTDRIAGLDAGADDYMVKPFDVDEMLARVRATVRRAAGRADSAYRFKGVVIDAANRQVSVENRSVELSAREWALLEPMIMRPGAVFSRNQLEEKLYGWREEISSNTVEVHIHKLRRKLGAELIRNIRGVGYMVPAE